uniref:BTB domain-containing protein n=2 Tax=Macrostomum lignano TaxID=282301 RepID=A0A1I8J9I8_9PLAT
ASYLSLAANHSASRSLPANAAESQRTLPQPLQLRAQAVAPSSPVRSDMIECGLQPSETATDNQSDSDSAIVDLVTDVEHPDRLLRQMAACWSDEALTDVTLIAYADSGSDAAGSGSVQSTCLRIPAHKLVLSAGSDYFRAMFQGRMSEAAASEVALHEVEPEALRQCVSFLYTGTLQLGQDNVESLLSAACLLQIRAVIDAASQYLAKQLHASNCLGIGQFAALRNCSKLQQAASAFAVANFPSVLMHQEFLGLSIDELVALLDSDELRVANESVVFEAILKWCDSDLAQRRADFPRALQTVRLCRLPPDYLANRVESHPLVRDCAVCLRQVLQAYRHQLRPQLQLQHACPRPRLSTVGKLLLLGGVADTPLTEILAYDPFINKWCPAGQLDSPRLQFGVACLPDNRIIVVGGRDGLKTTSSVICANLSGSGGGPVAWTSLQSMNTHRHGLGVGILAGVVYAIGGHDGWSYLNTVERWDTGAKSWSYVSPMSLPRSTVGVAALHGRLYAVGGRDGSSCLKTVESFNPHSQRWSLCAPLLKRRGGAGVSALGDHIYAVGGHDAPSSNPSAKRFACVERYDPLTDQWTLLASLSSPREAAAVGALGSLLVVCGGYDGTTHCDCVDLYDPATARWSSGATLPSGRAGAAAVAFAAA